MRTELRRETIEFDRVMGQKEMKRKKKSTRDEAEANVEEEVFSMCIV